MSYDPSHYYAGEEPPPPPLPPPREPDPYIRPVKSPPPPSSPTLSHKLTSGIKAKADHRVRKKGSIDSNVPPPALPPRDRPTRQSSLEPRPLPNIPKTPPAISKPPPRTPLSNKPPPPPPPTQTSHDSDDDDNYVDLSSPFHAPPNTCPVNPDIDGLGFLSFVDKYKEDFPIAFAVTMGYSGRGEEASISEGEKFVAHFQRRTRVYTIETDNKDIYSVPLNTSFEFAIIYDPNNNKKEALRGFIFKTAGDIMLLRTLPKVIRAKKHFRGISPESSVEANELLFVLEVVQKNVERAYVKCISGNTGREKQLHKECASDFTTSPHEIKTYLPDLLQHFQTPLRVMMCLGIDNTEDIPSSLISAVVNITQSHVMESIVASSITDDQDQDGEYITPDDISTLFLNDIPISFDININTMPVSPLNKEKLVENTKNLLDNFKPVGIYPYLTSYAAGQHALMKSLRKDEGNKVGIELIEPPSVKKLRESQSRYDQMSGDGLKQMSVLGGQLQEIRIRQDSMDSKVKEMERGIQSSLRQDSKVITGLQRESQQLRGDLMHLKQTVDELYRVVNSLSTSAPSSTSKGNTSTNASEVSFNSRVSEAQKQKNRLYLSKLGVEEIGDLLAVMNISQYAAKFASEIVDGELLLELSEDIIATELSVTSPLHRKRIMKLVTGDHSAESYFKGEGPYSSGSI